MSISLISIGSADRWSSRHRACGVLPYIAVQACKELAPTVAVLAAGGLILGTTGAGGGVLIFTEIILFSKFSLVTGKIPKISLFYSQAVTAILL